MTVATLKKPAVHKGLRPRVKLWIELQGEHVFCSGLCQMLEAVKRTGSIKNAAVEVDRSYRSVWSKIKQAELKLGEKLVDAHVGGEGVRRSSLTPLGERLVAKFLALRDKIHEVVDAMEWE